MKVKMHIWQKLPAAAGACLLAISGFAAAQQQPAARPPQPPAAHAAAPRPAPQGVAQQAPAQQAPTQQAPAATDTPQSTTATYADWIVQCVTRAGPPAEKVCEMAQVTQLQGKNVPFSRIAVEHPAKDQPVKLIVQVPVNASFATAVRLQTADADPGLSAPFAQCVPGGCFAEFDLKEDVLKKFRAASGTGKLSFADAGGHDVAVPLSFNGFAQAFEALVKE